MKQTIFIITVIILLFGVIYHQNNKINKINKQYVTDTVTVVETDTISIVQPVLQERKIVRYDTLRITDTVTITDTIEIPIPITEYILDTIVDSTAHLKGVFRGYNVEVDTLSIEYEKTRQNVSITRNKWSLSYGLVIGIGISKQIQ